MPHAQSRLGTLLRIALIVASGLVIYWPVVHGDWLWDDALEIARNVALRDLNGLLDAWIAPEGSTYYPLKTTLLWVQWQLWGDKPAGYHVTNIGLHITNALLVWRLFHAIGLRLAWVGGLVFAIHPIMVESVAWVTEQKNTTSLFFLLLAMERYVVFDRTGQRSTYGLAVAAFAAALLCKTAVVMLPAVVLVHGWWKRGQWTRRDIMACVPFAGMSVVMGMVTLWFEHHRAIGSWEIPSAGFVSRIAVAGLSASFYLWKALIPVNLMPVYPQWSLDPPSVLQLLPLPMLGGLGWWCWRHRSTWGRHAVFGLAFFILNLLPVLGFVPIAYHRYSWVADHFVYLPMIGIIGLVAAAAARMEERMPHRARRLAPGAAVVVGLGLIAVSRHHATVFDGPERFWTYALDRNPRAWVAHANLGNHAMQHERTADAIGHFEGAITINPRIASSHYNLGNALSRAGRYTEAIARYEEALRLEPTAVDTRINLGDALAAAGRREEAAAYYEEAVHLDPAAADAELALANVLLDLGLTAGAIAHFEAALRLRPEAVEAHTNLAVALLEFDRPGDALPHLRVAVRLEPADAALHTNLASVLFELGHLGEARRHLSRALELDPTFGPALVLRGRWPAQGAQR